MLSQRSDYGNSSHDNKDVVLIKLEFLVVYVIEELVFKGEEHSLLIDIYQNSKIGQQEELVACTARKLCQLFFKLLQLSKQLEKIDYFFFAVIFIFLIFQTYSSILYLFIIIQKLLDILNIRKLQNQYHRIIGSLKYPSILGNVLAYVIYVSELSLFINSS